MKESSLVSKIIAAVKVKYPNAYVRKLSDRFTRGIPDILIIVGTHQYSEYGSMTLMVETKIKNGKLSKLQEIELKSICYAGGEAISAYDVETVMAKLEEMGAV